MQKDRTNEFLVKLKKLMAEYQAIFFYDSDKLWLEVGTEEGAGCIVSKLQQSGEQEFSSTNIELQ